MFLYPQIPILPGTLAHTRDQAKDRQHASTMTDHRFMFVGAKRSPERKVANGLKQAAFTATIGSENKIEVGRKPELGKFQITEAFRLEMQ